MMDHRCSDADVGADKSQHDSRAIGSGSVCRCLVERQAVSADARELKFVSTLQCVPAVMRVSMTNARCDYARDVLQHAACLKRLAGLRRGRRRILHVRAHHIVT